jgi:putative membrane protein
MSWQAHPDAILMALALVALYVAGARWAGARCSPPARVTRAQAALYLSGVAVLYAGAGTPIHAIAERYLFSVHMVQHMMFALIAAPLLLLGTPGWMLRPLLKNRVVYRVAFVLTRPLPAFLLFNGVILVTHLPAVMDLALRNHSLHFVAHLFLVATALLMWMPVLSPVPELPRIGPFGQLVYLFVQSLLPAVIASFLAFSDRVVYEYYADAPMRYWGIGVHADQQIAAVIMKLGGAAIIWGVMAYVFFRWFGQEKPDSRVDAEVRWPEVEAELERMGLTKR